MDGRPRFRCEGTPNVVLWAIPGCHGAVLIETLIPSGLFIYALKDVKSLKMYYTDLTTRRSRVALLSNNCKHHGKNEVILRFNNVTFVYGKKPILSEATFSVRRGAKITLMGQNGAGKSTMFRLIQANCTQRKAT